MYFDDYMLPDQWHLLLNIFWTLQTFIAIFACLCESLYLPQHMETQWKDLPLVIRQFKFLLLSNTTFYVVELLITRMLLDHHSMAIHHLVAITIFTITLREPHMVCVASLLPYVMHNIHWALNSQYEIILYFYNAYFFLLGLWSTYVGYGSLLCKLSIVLPIVNYYSYCVFYDGAFCYNNSVVANLLTCSTFITTLIFVSNYTFSGIYR